jgi:hypothetical protein
LTDRLDSWAVLRWLEGDEPAASRVDADLVARPVMSLINRREVACIVERAAGADRARQIVQGLRRRLSLDVPSEHRVLEAARIKARYSMAYADAIAVAHRATLLTGRPRDTGRELGMALEDLRA